MTKSKPVKPARPICRHPELQTVEQLARERIAEIKQASAEQGKQASLTTTQILAPLDKIKMGQRRGHESVHGTSAEKEEKWALIARTYAALACDHRTWPKGRLEEETAKLSGVSVRTVQRHKKK